MKLSSPARVHYCLIYSVRTEQMPRGGFVNNSDVNYLDLANGYASTKPSATSH